MVRTGPNRDLTRLGTVPGRFIFTWNRGHNWTGPLYLMAWTVIGPNNLGRFLNGLRPPI